MQKIYVDDTNQATIICPKCALRKIIDVTDFRDTHKKMKARCRCEAGWSHQNASS